MKKNTLIILFCGLTLTANAQNASVEKSTYGIQTGFLGIWFHNETKLSNQIALRSEIGFDTGILIGSFYDKTGYILAPVLTIEPRWYYNLNKRVTKGRRIDGNSGNFISLKTSYHPDWFVISNYVNASIVSDVSIVPTWGIKRNVGNHITYETGIGIGYSQLVEEDTEFVENQGGVAINIHLRIGYRF